MLIEGIGVVAHRPHRYRFFIPYRYEKIIPHSTLHVALCSVPAQ